MSIEKAMKNMRTPPASHITAEGHQVSGKAWTNFAKIGSCQPAAHHYPSSLSEVVEVVQRIRATGEKCRVVGAGKSPNSCTFTTGHLIHMSKMNKILKVDMKECTVTCQGGVAMEHLLKTLDENGLMLRCVPSFVKTTVAGCIATATHSSGVATTSLSDYVTRLVLVDGTGTTHTFTRDGKTAKELTLAACHLGALGVVVEVTLQTEVKSTWHLRSRPLTFSEASDPASLADKVENHEYYRFWWVPHTDRCYESFGQQVDVAKEGPQRVAFQEWTKQRQSLQAKCMDAVKGDWLRHGVVERSLHLACRQPELQPIINNAYANTFYGAPSEQYGSTMECFTFDCLFKQWANEWAIPAEKAAEALLRLRDMLEAKKLRVHFPVELRFSGSDKTAMSPAHGRKTCWIGVVMYRPLLDEARDTKAYYDGFNEIVQSLGGRPHWAKYFAWCNEDMDRAYGKNWSDFLALRKQLDPSDLFVNPWLANLMSAGPQRVNTTEFMPATESATRSNL